MEKHAFGPGREFDLIRHFLRQAPAHDSIIVGPGDDAAVLRGGVVISTDAAVEGIHFRREWLEPAEIGYRAAACALSDLAALAAEPWALLVSLVLPASDYGKFAVELMAGVQRAASLVHAGLAGGDTAATSGPLVIDIVVVGQTDRPVLRSGARPGDHVFVTGELGGAAAAVAAWTRGERPGQEARRRYALPEPRIAQAHWLARHVELHALIDLSDGIASDAAHLAAASGCALIIRADQLPVGPEATLQLALSGGDDYELCFTADVQEVGAVALEFFEHFGSPLTDVGEVTSGHGLQIVDAGGKRLHARGWDHFGAKP
jgi:thiamine-monophosphate kinase